MTVLIGTWSRVCVCACCCIAVCLLQMQASGVICIDVPSVCFMLCLYSDSNMHGVACWCQRAKSTPFMFLCCNATAIINLP